MRRIRWKWLPLVLLLSPLVYLAGRWAVTWWLEPKPRYSLSFQPEHHVRHVHAEGSYLRIHSNIHGGYRDSFHQLSDGKPIHTYRSLSDGDRYTRERLGEAGEDISGLASKPYRYDVSRDPHDKSWDLLLDDNETGNHYRFIKHPRGAFYFDECNRSHTHCLMVHDREEYLGRLLLQGMFGNYPIAFVANLVSVMQLNPSAAYWRDVEFLSVLSIPDKRVITSDIVNPFKAYRQLAHGRITIRGLSPSGRWLVMGDDSEHTSGKRYEEDSWTNIYVYDTVRHRWLATVTKFNVIFDSTPEFLSDDLIGLSSRDYSSSGSGVRGFIVHLPSGTVVEKRKDIFDVHLSAFHDNPHEYCSYLKTENLQDMNSRLTAVVVDEMGKTTNIHEKTFPFRLNTSSPCSGSQAFCDKWFNLTLPKWMEEWFPKGRIHDLIQNWRMQSACFVYDFPNDQMVASWTHRWKGYVSDDGKTLVMNDIDTDYLVKRAEVYDLPLPVWSPWWSRGTGIGLVLLLCLLLVRRRGAGLYATPA